MGKNFTGLSTEKKLNAPRLVSNGVSHDRRDVSPKASRANGYSVARDHNGDSIAVECPEKQDVLGIKSTNHNAALKPEVLKSSEEKLSTPVKGKAQVKNHASQMQALTEPSPVKPKTVDGCASSSSNSNDMHSPSSAKKPQPSSPQISRNPHQPYHKQHHDEEDNWSVLSSTASIRTAKFRPTVAVAPLFKSVERANRRKEFYTKLEEKQQALEAEKTDYTARTKEEEQAAIKQLRKSMTYKANPVPSFYQEGPPPKVEIKKLPLTRAKSPNLTRRKSCGNVVSGSPSVEKTVCTRAVRHSIGGHFHGSPVSSPLKKKDQINASNGKDRPKITKGTTNKATPQKIVEPTADIAVSG